LNVAVLLTGFVEVALFFSEFLQNSTEKYFFQICVFDFLFGICDRELRRLTNSYIMSAEEIHQFSQVPIHNDDWSNFCEYTQDHYLGRDASDLTETNKNFMETKIMTNSEVLDILKYTMRIFRDVITYELPMPNVGDYLNFNDNSIDERKAILSGAFRRALTEFSFHQESVAGRLTEDKQVFKDIAISFEEVPVRFLIDVGRFLGFSREPNSGSWDHAGRSYNFRMFCTTLFNDIHDIPRGQVESAPDEDGYNALLDPLDGDDGSGGEHNHHDDNDDDDDDDDDEGGIGNGRSSNNGWNADGWLHWNARIGDATILRLIFLHIVDKHLSKDAGYVEATILDTYLPEAIQMFNENAAVTNVKHKYPVTLTGAIRKTAAQTWLSRVTSQSKGPEPVPMPSGDFLEGIRTNKVRTAWHNYFAYRISFKKIKCPNVSPPGMRHKAPESVASSTKNRTNKRDRSGSISSSATPIGCNPLSREPSPVVPQLSLVEQFNSNNVEYEADLEVMKKLDTKRHEESCGLLRDVAKSVDSLINFLKQQEVNRLLSAAAPSSSNK
jgi:hypothetical protein